MCSNTRLLEPRLPSIGQAGLESFLLVRSVTDEAGNVPQGSPYRLPEGLSVALDSVLRPVICTERANQRDPPPGAPDSPPRPGHEPVAWRHLKGRVTSHLA